MFQYLKEEKDEKELLLEKIRKLEQQVDSEKKDCAGILVWIFTLGFAYGFYNDRSMFTWTHNAGDLWGPLLVVATSYALARAYGIPGLLGLIAGVVLAILLYAFLVFVYFDTPLPW